MGNYIRRESKTFFWLEVFICILTPPIWGMIYFLLKYIQTKRSNLLYFFLASYALFLTYNTLSVDNTLRVLTVYYYDLFMLSDPLSALMSIVVNSIDWIQCNNFLYLYIFAVYAFLLSAVKRITSGINLLVFAIFLFSYILRDAVDLLYYALSLSFTLFYVLRERLNKKNVFVLLLIQYLFHPGVILITFPMLWFVYLKQTNRIKLLKGSYIILFFASIGFFNGAANYIGTTGIPFIDSILSIFLRYTSNERWGADGTMHFKMLYLLYFRILLLCLTLIVTFNKRKQLDRIFPLVAFFQAATIMSLTTIDYATINERFVLSAYISSTLIWLYIIMYRIVRIKELNTTLSLFALFIYVFSFYSLYAMVGTSVSSQDMISLGKSSEVRQRVYYIPSVLLFDYKSYGFSDEYIIHNTALDDQLEMIQNYSKKH